MDPFKAQEIRDATGNVIGHFMPGKSYLQLRDVYEDLRQRMRASVPLATPEQEEEFRRQLATEPLIDGEEAVSAILRELEDGNGKH